MMERWMSARCAARCTIAWVATREGSRLTLCDFGTKPSKSWVCLTRKAFVRAGTNRCLTAGTKGLCVVRRKRTASARGTASVGVRSADGVRARAEIQRKRAWNAIGAGKQMTHPRASRAPWVGGGPEWIAKRGWKAAERAASELGAMIPMIAHTGRLMRSTCSGSPVAAVKIQVQRVRAMQIASHLWREVRSKRWGLKPRTKWPQEGSGMIRVSARLTIRRSDVEIQNETLRQMCRRIHGCHRRNLRRRQIRLHRSRTRPPTSTMPHR
mmetsp:Transcript_9942/g.26465  ORF Transcript_9942/g.26465 Transcript_9942/m.26465 type:complete len:268 (-) Transcript_9942:689-1492(-)